jgi:hypothetical protein
MRISRRTVLRGSGALVALPVLEAMLPRRAHAATDTPILVAFFVPNSLPLEFFVPAATGSGFELTPLLEPLAAHRESLVVVSGVQGVGGPDSHAAGTCAFSTGVECSTLGAGGPSFDQVAAQQLGGDLPFASLVVTANNQASYDSNGYSSACFANVSWSAAEQPVPAERDPAVLFTRLFGDGTPLAAIEAERRLARRRSVLDNVKADIDRLRPRLGNGDRMRLEAHLDAVREVEQRLDVQVSCEVPDPPSGYPESTWETGYDERARLLLDLLALGLSCGLTRYGSFMYHDGGADDPGDIAAGLPGRHHSAAHEANRETMRQYSLVHMDALAYFLDRLAAAPGSTGSLLDDALVVCGTELGDGTGHTAHDLPFVLAGGAGGSIAGGRHLATDGAPVSALHLSVLRTCGVELESFGGTSQTLPDL